MHFTNLHPLELNSGWKGPQAQHITLNYRKNLDEEKRLALILGKMSTDTYCANLIRRKQLYRKKKKICIFNFR